MVSMKRGWLWAATLGVATVAGACTSVLDFTECYTDDDCATFFEDNKPMRCDVDNNRCAPRTEGCDQNSECEPLGESYICGFSHRCFDHTVGEELCDAPVYPEGADDNDGVVFVGSMINRAGDGAAIENGIRLAIEEFNANASLASESHPKIAWFACDTQGDAARAREIAEFLAGSADSENAVGVAAMIGPFDNNEFTEVVEEVSLAGNINAFTISPTSLIEEFSVMDKGNVVWRGGPGATRYANAMLARLNDATPLRMLTILSNDPTRWALFQAMAVKKDVGGQERWWIDIDDIDGEMGAQGITSYNGVDNISDAVMGAVGADLGGDPQVLLILGGAESGQVLEEYYTQAGTLPELVVVPHWGLSGMNEALTRINDAAAIDALEIISPEMPNADVSAQFDERFQSRFSAAPLADAYQAYDATLITLFSMAGVADGSILGPKISTITRGLLNGDTPTVSAADPATYDDGGKTLANGNAVELIGAAYPIEIDAARKEVCTDFIALGASGSPSDPAIEPKARYQVNCPNEVAGTW